MKERRNFFFKKDILASPGFEPTTCPGDHFITGTFMNSPHATCGKTSSVQLAQSKDFKVQSSRLLMWRTMGPKLF
jgi:hypothetical protein